MNKKMFNAPVYDGFQSSCEILLACEIIGEDNILNPNGYSYQIWANPSPIDSQRVESLAWNYASDDTEVLFWGLSRIKRPSQK